MFHSSKVKIHFHYLNFEQYLATKFQKFSMTSKKGQTDIETHHKKHLCFHQIYKSLQIHKLTCTIIRRACMPSCNKKVWSIFHTRADKRDKQNLIDQAECLAQVWKFYISRLLSEDKVLVRKNATLQKKLILLSTKIGHVRLEKHSFAI